MGAETIPGTAAIHRGTWHRRPRYSAGDGGTMVSPAHYPARRPDREQGHKPKRPTRAPHRIRAGCAVDGLGFSPAPNPDLGATASAGGPTRPGGSGPRVVHPWRCGCNGALARRPATAGFNRGSRRGRGSDGCENGRSDAEPERRDGHAPLPQWWARWREAGRRVADQQSLGGSQARPEELNHAPGGRWIRRPRHRPAGHAVGPGSTRLHKLHEAPAHDPIRRGATRG